MGRAASDVVRMERKREKTETVGTGFGIAAAIEGTGAAAIVVACDGLIAAADRGEEVFCDAEMPAEARLVAGC